MIAHLRDVGPNSDRALAILQRLFTENPEAIREFLGWVERPRHTQTISLHFHGGKLKCARAELTSNRAEEP